MDLRKRVELITMCEKNDDGEGQMINRLRTDLWIKKALRSTDSPTQLP